MALAFLDVADNDKSSVTFKVDIGTNTQYELRIGSSVREEDGSEWVDDVYYKTAPKQITGGDPLFDTAKEVPLPLKVLQSGQSYAQLFSWKSNGRAKAYSKVVPVSGAFSFVSDSPAIRRAFPGMVRRSASLSLRPEVPVMSATSYNPPRMIDQRPAFSRQASWTDILGDIVKIAAPVVQDLLKDGSSGSGGGAASGASAGASAGGGPMDILAQILKSVLGAVTGSQKPAAAGAQAPAGGTPDAAKTPVSLGKSLSLSYGSRFTDESLRHRGNPYSQALIFGIDDALIGALAGPILQVLPQLMNAANQHKLDMKKENDQLVSGLVSDVNKRMMMEKLADAQAAAAAQGPAAPISEDQIKALAAVLAQLPTAKSLSLSASDTTPSPDLSKKAILAFTFQNQVQWNGKDTPVFDRGKTIVLRPQFTVAEPAPKSPLPKAILKLVLQDAGNPAVRVEKEFKLKDVLANAALECSVEPGELSHLPPNAPISVVAELRWPNARTGAVTKALGSTEIVLVNRFFVKSRGTEVSDERELTDMTQYRPFWNKIWDAPVLDGARATDDNKKYSWDLNVNTKYSVVVSPDHDSNGLMETKVLKEADDPDSLTNSVHGRMKAGIELSLSELNKLTALWSGYQPLDAASLEALRAKPFIDDTAREFIYNFKLHGRAGQSGMVWVIPTFKLFGVTLSSVAAANDDGQVTATSEQNVQFPLPVSARLIGLKSAA